MQLTRYHHKLQPDSNSLRPSILGLIIGLFICFYAIVAVQSTMYQLSLFILALFIYFFVRFISKSEEIVEVKGTILNIQKYSFGIRKEISIPLSEISRLKYQTHIKSDTYTSKGHIRFLGIDKTPEEWKTCYYHPELITFNHNNKRYEIGKWKKPFNGQLLYQILKSKKLS